MTDRVHRDGIALAVDEHGAGHPVVLQPGLGYARWCWRWLVPELTADWRVITLDPRGTGRSTKVDEPFTVEDLADDLAAVIEERAGGRAHVVGHSMGGYVAISLALRHPATVRSLALLATSAGGPDNVPVPEETVRAWRENAGQPPEVYARRTFPYSFRPGWTEEHPERTEEALEVRLANPTPPDQWLLQYEATVPWLRQGRPVEEISVPTLVVHGNADRVVPHANGQHIARRMPTAELITFEGVGHNLMIEEPHRLAAVLREFWTRLPDPGDETVS